MYSEQNLELSSVLYDNPETEVRSSKKKTLGFLRRSNDYLFGSHLYPHFAQRFTVFPEPINPQTKENPRDPVEIAVDPHLGHFTSTSRLLLFLLSSYSLGMIPVVAISSMRNIASIVPIPREFMWDNMNCLSLIGSDELFISIILLRICERS